jgi:Domain of unknown function (DUF4386)
MATTSSSGRASLRRPRRSCSVAAIEALPHLGLYRRATAAALVVAPAILLLDNLLHPKEYEGGAGNEAKQLAEIADHYTRWQLAHLFGFLAIVLFAVAVAGLAFLVRRRQPRLGLVGGALGIAGLIGFASVISLDGFTWGVLGEVSSRPGSDPATVATALEEIQGSNWSLPFYLLPLAWIVGMVMLSVAAVRQGAVPAWAGILLLVAALVAGTEPIVISNAYFIAGAAALLAGGAAVGLHIARMGDAEFAAGGPASSRRAE